MKKKILISFLIAFIAGIPVTTIFSASLIRNFYYNTLEDKLISDCKLIVNIFKDEYNKEKDNYDELASRVFKLIDARVTIVSVDGTVIGESSADRNSMDNHYNRDEIKTGLSGKIGKSIRYSSTEGVDMMYVAVPVEIQNVVIGAVRLSLPLTEVQKLQYVFFRYTVIALLAGFSGSSIIAYLFMKNNLKPIKEVTEACSKIADGRYEKRINKVYKDEAGKLAAAFNSMADKLESTIYDLSDQKNKLEAILKSMNSGVIAVDSLNRIILINPAAIGMFGIKGNVIGKHILEIVRNTELEEIVNDHQEESREIIINYPERKILRIKAESIKDTISKRDMGAVIVIQDITEIKKLEQMRTDFVANVSHELKTPLTSIKGFAETLKSGAIEDTATRDKFLDIINVEAERLTGLINDILTISELENKRQRIADERININKSIDEIEYIMTELAKFKNINIKFDKCEGMPYVLGNHDKIKQLLINLVDNAIKYTQEGGSVTVKTRVRNDRVYIEVSDTGIGISKEHITRIFERFYRVDKGRSRSLGGTGLGLAIVKHIAANMDGKITVNSEPNKGTDFIIELPIA